jgi:hypothetical protein
LAFSLSSLSVTHLRTTSRADQSEKAINVARSTISLAIARITENPDFGRTRAAGEPVRVTLGGAEGYLTFNQGEASGEELAYSTNNLLGTEDAEGAESTIVASATVHLVAIGRSGGATRRVEATLHIPPFPWAIASGGKISTENGVLVAALPKGTWDLPTDLSQLGPADLAANGVAEDAIVLQNQSTVTGDVETPGNIVLGSTDVDVKGEIRPGSKPIDLPILDPADYDPLTRGLEFTALQDGNVSELVGTARSDGDLVFNAPLKLEQACLFVDGDLNVMAGLTGNGVVIATGDVNIQGGAVMTSETDLAVLAGGTARVTGQGTASSKFRGLVYAQEGLEASELTIIGSLVTGNAATGSKLDHVNAIYDAPPAILTTSGGISNDTFHVGTKTGDGTVSSGGIHTFQFNQTPPRTPQGIGSGLMSVRIESTAGSYPLTVTLERPSGENDVVQMAGPEDFPDLMSAIETIIGPAYPFLTPSPEIFKSRLTTRLESLLVDPFRPGQISSAITLYGEISRFLPMEDKIRVISWLEK